MLIYEYMGFVFLLSFSNVYYAIALDYSMDYGNILGFIRLWVAKRINSDVIEAAKSGVVGASTEIKVNALNNAYWELVGERGGMFLKGIICIDCMVIRINLIVQLMLVYFGYMMGVSSFVLLFGFISSIGLNYFFYGLRK